MNIPRILRSLAPIGFLLCAPSKAVASKAPEPVAIVYSLTGDASVEMPKAVRRPLRLFDRLPARTVVKVGPDSRVALAFANGLRYELGEHARAELGAAGFSSRTGPVRPLPRVPTLPCLASIAEADKPGRRMAALRSRYAGSKYSISGLYPRRGVVSLASATRLRFNPVPEATKYAVRIIDQEDEVVFDLEIQSTEIHVPSGVLAPGRTYLWTVETRDFPGVVIEGRETFETLDASRAQAREEVRQWVQRSETASDLWLLAGVDQILGLKEEARQSINSARCRFSTPGVVVETVALESAAYRAGLAPGDRLFSWCRASAGKEGCVARGDLHNPFDWLNLQMEDVQRGGVIVEGELHVVARLTQP